LSKKIVFSPSSEYVSKHVQRPLPAKNYIPEWLKPQEKLTFKNAEMGAKGEVLDRSVNRCMPFREAITAGYIQESWTEIMIRVNDDKLEWYVSGDPEIVSNVSLPSGVCIGSEYYPAELVFKMVWYPRVPKGYSILVCPPFNRLDLPFTCSSGIIEADTFHHVGAGNIPFFIKSGFEGVIPIGTPLFQMIPIKRDSWTGEALDWDADALESLAKETSRRFMGYYKKTFWIKKNYN
jgi:hypothetical protein